jgi:branched-chain amino acid transport system ATP-binding protein
MLRVNDVRVRYGAICALESASVTVTPGEVVAVVGSNGAGKTSLMSAIAGIVPVSGGAITLDDVPLSGRSADAIVGLGLALVPEGRELFPRMTVRDTLLLGATRVRDRAEKQTNYRRVTTLFPVLAHKRDTQARRLSGGEQQMLAFGRALMASPRFLLLDEPSIGLAPLIEAQMMASVREIARDLGVGVLLAEQNAMLALEAADRGYVLELGRIARSGSAKRLLSDRRIIESYLGGTH